MIDGKQPRGWCSIQGGTTSARHGGRDKGRGGEAAHRGGGYRGRKREAGAGEEERKTQRGEKVRRVGVVLVQLLARVYI